MILPIIYRIDDFVIMSDAFVWRMEAASPDLEKQGFFAVVFVCWEYSEQPDP